MDKKFKQTDLLRILQTKAQELQLMQAPRGQKNHAEKPKSDWLIASGYS